MRSLKAERMPRENPRVRSTRKPSRPVREAASSRGRRESSGDGVIAPFADAGFWIGSDIGRDYAEIALFK